MKTPPAHRLALWLGAASLTLASLSQASSWDQWEDTSLYVGTGANAGMVYDAAQEITWLQNANLFQSQAADNDSIVSDIINALETVSYDDGSGGTATHNLTTSDFSPSNGMMTWYGALAWASWLNYGGFDDWRLWGVTSTATTCDSSVDGSTDCGFNVNTNNSELAHLWYETLGNLGYYAKDGTVPQPGYGLNNTGPFTSFDETYYWSGSEVSSSSDDSWIFFAILGAQGPSDFRGQKLQAWAVRSGEVDVALLATPLPGAFWLMGTALLAAVGAGRRRLGLWRFA